MKKYGIREIGVTAVLIGFAVAVNAAGSPAPAVPEPVPMASPSPKSQAMALYAEGKELSDRERHADALSVLVRAIKLDPASPEILNMLAYNQRKTGDLDTAIANYQKALLLRPRFPEAREYLGEAYLQAALRELNTLQGYGETAAHEYEDLKRDIIEAGEKLEGKKKEKPLSDS